MKKFAAVGIGVGISLAIIIIVLMMNPSANEKLPSKSEQNQSSNVISPTPLNTTNFQPAAPIGRHLEVNLSESVGIKGH